MENAKAKTQMPIYLMVAVPGSGKSWVAKQLSESFEVVKHDDFIGIPNSNDAYIDGILEKASQSNRPLLIEAPFSISQIKEPIEAAGYEVVPVFIQEDEDTVSRRYFEREGKEIPKGHLTRMQTYRRRAEEWEAFQGTSEEVLKFLKTVTGGTE